MYANLLFYHSCFMSTLSAHYLHDFCLLFWSLTTLYLQRIQLSLSLNLWFWSKNVEYAYSKAFQFMMSGRKNRLTCILCRGINNRQYYITHLEVRKSFGKWFPHTKRDRSLIYIPHTHDLTGWLDWKSSLVRITTREWAWGSQIRLFGRKISLVYM